MKGGDKMKYGFNDHVICSNCDAEQIVEKGSDICLNCGESGKLQFVDLDQPESLMEIQIIKNTYFLNRYKHCNVEWEDEWSCMCNDRCPVCNAEIEPYESIEIEE